MYYLTVFYLLLYITQDLQLEIFSVGLENFGSMKLCILPLNICTA